MDREKLETLLQTKLKAELDSFREQTLRKNREEIYNSAYEIESVTQIYQVLCVNVKNAGAESLEALLVFPELLLFLYGRWLKYEDSQMEDMNYCLNRELEDVISLYRMKKEGRAA